MDDLKIELVSALHQSRLNHTALSLLLSQAAITKYFTSDQQLGLGLFSTSSALAIVALTGLMMRSFKRSPILFMSGLLMVISCVLIIDVSSLKRGMLLELKEAAIPTGLLEGSVATLRDLVTSIYDNGFMLKELTCESFRDGSVYNYFTVLMVDTYKLNAGFSEGGLRDIHLIVDTLFVEGGEVYMVQ